MQLIFEILFFATDLFIEDELEHPIPWNLPLDIIDSFQEWRENNDNQDVTS